MHGNDVLSDEALDVQILEALFPEEQKSGVQLSVDVVNSGGAINTGIRLEDLRERKLIFLCYETRNGGEYYWRLTLLGKWQVDFNSRKKLKDGSQDAKNI